eukprot:TRINITY_DN8381_c2_g2_i2.p1 TRINITY_DN8381_c2_g2~~TRINITY_DN8381_c2_g2_i2.p1  ORF type:complete len:1499 (+),score=374.57 TRINITY_DN8381_c2_g2_i2:73-4497(+)
MPNFLKLFRSKERGPTGASGGGGGGGPAARSGGGGPAPRGRSAPPGPPPLGLAQRRASGAAETRLPPGYVHGVDAIEVTERLRRERIGRDRDEDVMSKIWPGVVHLTLRYRESQGHDTQQQQQQQQQDRATPGSRSRRSLSAPQPVRKLGDGGDAGEVIGLGPIGEPLQGHADRASRLATWSASTTPGTQGGGTDTPEALVGPRRRSARGLTPQDNRYQSMLSSAVSAEELARALLTNAMADSAAHKRHRAALACAWVLHKKPQLQAQGLGADPVPGLVRSTLSFWMPRGRIPLDFVLSPQAAPDPRAPTPLTPCIDPVQLINPSQLISLTDATELDTFPGRPHGAPAPLGAEPSTFGLGPPAYSDTCTVFTVSADSNPPSRLAQDSFDDVSPESSVLRSSVLTAASGTLRGSLRRGAQRLGSPGARPGSGLSDERASPHQAQARRVQGRPQGRFAPAIPGTERRSGQTPSPEMQPQRPAGSPSLSAASDDMPQLPATRQQRERELEAEKARERDAAEAERAARECEREREKDRERERGRRQRPAPGSSPQQGQHTSVAPWMWGGPQQQPQPQQHAQRAAPTTPNNLGGGAPRKGSGLSHSSVDTQGGVSIETPRHTAGDASGASPFGCLSSASETSDHHRSSPSRPAPAKGPDPAREHAHPAPQEQQPAAPAAAPASPPPAASPGTASASASPPPDSSCPPWSPAPGDLSARGRGFPSYAPLDTARTGAASITRLSDDDPLTARSRLVPLLRGLGGSPPPAAAAGREQPAASSGESRPPPRRLIALRKLPVRNVEQPWKGDGKVRWLCTPADCGGSTSRACAHESVRGLWTIKPSSRGADYFYVCSAGGEYLGVDCEDTSARRDANSVFVTCMSAKSSACLWESSYDGSGACVVRNVGADGKTRHLGVHHYGPRDQRDGQSMWAVAHEWLNETCRWELEDCGTCDAAGPPSSASSARSPSPVETTLPPSHAGAAEPAASFAERDGSLTAAVTSHPTSSRPASLTFTAPSPPRAAGRLQQGSPDPVVPAMGSAFSEVRSEQAKAPSTPQHSAAGDSCAASANPLSPLDQTRRSKSHSQPLPQPREKRAEAERPKRSVGPAARSAAAMARATLRSLSGNMEKPQRQQERAAERRAEASPPMGSPQVMDSARAREFSPRVGPLSDQSAGHRSHPRRSPAGEPYSPGDLLALAASGTPSRGAAGASSRQSPSPPPESRASPSPGSPPPEQRRSPGGTMFSSAPASAAGTERRQQGRRSGPSFSPPPPTRGDSRNSTGEARAAPRGAHISMHLPLNLLRTGSGGASGSYARSQSQPRPAPPSASAAARSSTQPRPAHPRAAQRVAGPSPDRRSVRSFSPQRPAAPPQQGRSASPPPQPARAAPHARSISPPPQQRGAVHRQPSTLASASASARRPRGNSPARRPRPATLTLGQSAALTQQRSAGNLVRVGSARSVHARSTSPVRPVPVVAQRSADGRR